MFRSIKCRISFHLIWVCSLEKYAIFHFFRDYAVLRNVKRQQHLIESVQRTQFPFSQFTVKFIYQLEFKQCSSWGMAIDVQEPLQIEKRTLHFQFILSPMNYLTINCHRCSVCNAILLFIFVHFWACLC